VELRDYVRLLRRRWRLVALSVLLGLAAATAVTLAAPKEYTATAQLFVSASDASAAGGGASISTAYTGGLFTQQRVKSYVSVITSIRTATLVKDDLGLPNAPGELAGKVTATAPLDTVLINVSVKDRSPAQAQQLANSIGKVFPGLVDSIEKPNAGGVSPVKVSVVQPAQLPGAPTSPKPKLNLALGLLVGLGVGIGGAVLRETLDTSVKGPEQAQDLVGAPVLGAISYDPEASKKPLVVVASPNSVRAESFRQLRTNLQFVDIEHPLRSVVFTSSIPGEGKSTTTCNLAITLAQAGLQVILVEGDLRRPRIADYMGMEGAVGLTSVLLGRTGLDDALQPWGDGTLQVLASGPLPPNPSELLGSQGMQDLLRELEGRADIVIIDAPPLLPVTDAAVLGTLTSGLVMLIRSNETRREQLIRAVATVHAVGATMLGSVLNMVPTKGPDAYSYGYGYGYSYKATAATGRLTTTESPVGQARRSDEPSPSPAAPAAIQAPAAAPFAPAVSPPAPAVPPAPPAPVALAVPAAPMAAPVPSAVPLPSAPLVEGAPYHPQAMPSVVAAVPPVPAAPSFLPVESPRVESMPVESMPSLPSAAEEEPEIDYFTKATKTAGSDSWWERAQSQPSSEADR
jgi:capsular exopolysaccharide synthesis family protein